MPTVAEHYTNLLAPVYLWMVGGIDAALAQGAMDIAPFCAPAATSRTAVDLGAGFGMHAIPLARSGYVEELFSKVARSITPCGTFVLTFRDYTKPPTGQARFIPVRSDSDRILTCFLETSPTHIEVHDVLHERDGSNWRMHVSSYKKLRLSPEWVVRALEMRGFGVRKEQAPRGMVRVIATGA